LTGSRRLIPIYDATAPIVCTLTAGEVQERRDLLEWLRAHLTEVDRTEHGLLLRFPADPDVEMKVRRFAVAEQRCCGFWGFEVAATTAAVSLRWDAPPAADELVERLVAYFGGDDRFGLEGLL
jgi:hypothetical protein